MKCVRETAHSQRQLAHIALSLALSLSLSLALSLSDTFAGALSQRLSAYRMVTKRFGFHSQIYQLSEGDLHKAATSLIFQQRVETVQILHERVYPTEARRCYR
eukprot:GHVU01123913.1.p3 GENE.GHVU01123913.1~~GHVU01123913.1.p3  ORF type:complete len:103 (+),score=6.58 GHVU01123913.1:711-1019(+)